MKDLEFRLDLEGKGGTMEAFGRQVHKISFVDCASGHTREVAVLKAMWQIRPGVRYLGFEYQDFHFKVMQAISSYF